MPISATSAGLTLKEAILNQYQAILASGAAGLALLAGDVWPLLVFAGFECLVLPLVVGNARLARAFAMRSLRPEAEGQRRPLSTEGLDPARRQRLEVLEALAGTIEKSFARLSESSRALVGEEQRKLATILETALAHLQTLHAYDELDRQMPSNPGQDAESLRKKLLDPSLSDRLRASYQEALDFQTRLEASLRRSRETREAIATQLGTLETALRILAQESAGLQAPTEVSARLDELVADAERTGRTLEELEGLSREASEAARGARGRAVAQG